MVYSEGLLARAAAMIARKESSLDVDIVDVFSDIDWTQDAANDAYFAILIRAKVIKSNTVTLRRTRERARGKLIESIGCEPNTPIEFVSAQAKRLQVEINMKGSLIVEGQHKNVLALSRMMRMKALELALDFDRMAIDDATEHFVEEAIAARPAIIAATMATRQPFDWLGFARAFFRSTDEMPSEMVAAVLRKFVHQVRRKLAGKSVQHHLMPVIHGPQGCGKTFLLERMLAPLAEATAWSNFEQLVDDRNIALWKNVVIVLDEMARAAKADVETIKHVITAETLDRRPMRSNMTISVQNCAVMIGASNHRLDEIIRDETGNRRFVELVYQRPNDLTLIDQFDFVAMWSSVQPDDVDPLAEWRDDLKRVQADFITLGPVEDWLLNDREVDHIFGDIKGVTTETLYRAFKAWRATVTAGIDYQARSQAAFVSELRRVTDQRADMGIRKVHTRSGNRWVCDRQEAPAARLRGILGGDAA